MHIKLFEDTGDAQAHSQRVKLHIAATTGRTATALDDLDEEFPVVNPTTLKKTSETSSYQQLLVLLLSARVHEAAKWKRKKKTT